MAVCWYELAARRLAGQRHGQKMIVWGRPADGDDFVTNLVSGLAAEQFHEDGTAFAPVLMACVRACATLPGKPSAVWGGVPSGARVQGWRGRSGGHGG